MLLGNGRGDLGRDRPNKLDGVSDEHTSEDQDG